MLNRIKYYFAKRQQRLTDIKKIDMNNSKKYRQTVLMLSRRLISYETEGRLSHTEVATLCYLIKIIREETIEALKTDIYMHILNGCTSAMSEIKGVHRNG